MANVLPRLVKGFYYSLLDIDEQMLYKEIGLAVANLKDSVKVKKVHMKMLRKILMAITYDNPEFFYWNSSLSELRGDSLCLQYSVSKEETLETLATIREERKKVADMCNDAEDKLSTIYKYIKENVVYAHEEIKADDQPKWIYSLEGVFLQKKAACLGIAQAVNYLCYTLKIPHMIVTGEGKLGGEMMKHAWNLVEVNGKYRHLDVTAEIYENSNNEYQYFLLKDWEMIDRTWPENTYPKAE